MEVVYRQPKIYLISGKARHGKTTVGKMLKRECEKRGKKVATTLFVKYLKDYAISFFGWDGKEETKPREFLQKLGTDIIRQKLNKPEFFINRTIEDVEILSYFFDVIIIDDVRFPIEINKFRAAFDNVVCINVVRDNFDSDLTEDQKKHATEIALDDFDDYEYHIHNNGTIEDLDHDIKAIVKKEEIQDEKND